MNANQLKRITSVLVTPLRRTVGLALVLSACAGTAVAIPPNSPVPEIDPGSAAGAITLLAGGWLLLRDRWRRS